MKSSKYIFILVTLLLASCVKKRESSLYYQQANAPITHGIWNQLVQKHVDDKTGLVSYKGFIKDSALLNHYLVYLNHHTPGLHASQQDKKAFWINAYNAFTVKLIVDEYPLKSITHLHPKPYIPFINTVWNEPRFFVNKQSISLDYIEHELLRKEFDDPRIHFAINCASLSCPVLLNKSYQADILDQQLDQQARRFINDPLRNELATGKLSSIFNWFASDFSNGQNSLYDFVSQYAVTKLPASQQVTFLPYDWSLNEKK